MDPALLLLAAAAFLQVTEPISPRGVEVFFGGFADRCNGFFVAAEFSLVSIRDTRIQQLIEATK